jgi:hypothetical protein
MRISDVLGKLGPYMKLYAEYASNFDKLPKTYAQLLTSNTKFSLIVKEIQATPECASLPLSTHLVEPVQRIMRYHMLLEVRARVCTLLEQHMQAYQKCLPPGHPDLVDTQKAYALCRGAAEHADSVMKRMVCTCPNTRIF